jgi:hypothetical protein
LMGTDSSPGREGVPLQSNARQGLKPDPLLAVSARVNSCPDFKTLLQMACFQGHLFGDSKSAFNLPCHIRTAHRKMGDLKLLHG